jgi:hypothetical protein
MHLLGWKNTIWAALCLRTWGCLYFEPGPKRLLHSELACVDMVFMLECRLDWA